MKQALFEVLFLDDVAKEMLPVHTRPFHTSLKSRKTVKPNLNLSTSDMPNRRYPCNVQNGTLLLTVLVAFKTDKTNRIRRQNRDHGWQVARHL